MAGWHHSTENSINSCSDSFPSPPGRHYLRARDGRQPNDRKTSLAWPVLQLGRRFEPAPLGRQPRANKVASPSRINSHLASRFGTLLLSIKKATVNDFWATTMGAALRSSPSASRRMKAPADQRGGQNIAWPASTAGASGFGLPFVVEPWQGR